MTTRKSKTKKIIEKVYQEPEHKFQEIEQTPIIETNVEVPQQETIITEQPKQEATFLVKKIRLIHNVGSLKEGTIIDITRCENGRLYFKLGDAEAYFDSSENNRLYAVVE